MLRNRSTSTLALLVFLLIAVLPGFSVQNAPAVDHALQVLEALRDGRFDDIAAEFNDSVAAALSAERLGQVWTMLQSQVGAFASAGEPGVANVQGVAAVTIECRFERAALNMIVAFDAQQKIAGLRFVPAQTGNAAPAPPPSGLVEETVTVGSGPWALPGTLTRPGTEGRVPAVVLVHGSGPNDRDETIGAHKPFRDLAWGLAGRGVAVLRYEKRTREYASRFTANTRITVWEETIEDALSALDLLASDPRVDSSRVFLLGHSLGGTLAPRIGAENPEIAGLVILAGATRPLPELIVEQAEYLTSLDPSPSTETYLERLRAEAQRAMDPGLGMASPDTELLGVPVSYWLDLNVYSPVEVAQSLADMPMLILQGGRDYQVTLEDLAGWREGLGGRSNVEIAEYPDLNHLFVTGEGLATPAEYQRPGNVAETLIDDIANWIHERR